MSLLQLNRNVSGKVRLGPRGLTLPNTLTYKSGDILVNAMTNRGPHLVTHLYCRYNGNTTLSPLTPSGADLKNTVRADFFRSDSLSGGFYVPLLAAPAVDSSDTDNYDGNRMRFYFRIPSTVDEDNGLTGDDFEVATSHVSAIGLAVAQDAGDRSMDWIFSVLQLSTETMFPLVVSGQKLIDYPVTIDFPS